MLRLYIGVNTLTQRYCVLKLCVNTEIINRMSDSYINTEIKKDEK
jgi:hypothetical protein